MHDRQNALNKWLNEALSSSPFSLNSLTGDASFRRYFRLNCRGINQIVMDAPPDKESLESFLAVGDLLSTVGVRTPKIQAVDKEQGFALLDDFGDVLLLQKVRDNDADSLYLQAIDTLCLMQACSTAQLPSFDNDHILYELSIFKEWFLQAYLKLELSAQENDLLDNTFSWLSSKITQQPQVFIHRDYHSRNIMLIPNMDKIELGIIDFQDAMRGPIAYDLVSLLKDCYVQWPQEKLTNWLTYFYNQNVLAKQHYSQADFISAFDYCGLQRHLKVLGVFSRLYLRDSKPNYLQDLPLVLHYVTACLEQHEELNDFYQFVQNRIRLP